MIKINAVNQPAVNSLQSAVADCRLLTDDWELIIADFISEYFLPGVYDENKDVILLQPGKPVTNGIKIG